VTPFRAVISWLLLLAVAFLNGALRQLAYPSTLDDFAARQVAVGVGAAALGATMWGSSSAAGQPPAYGRPGPRAHSGPA
jgi:hypothetical protein